MPKSKSWFGLDWYVPPIYVLMFGFALADAIEFNFRWANVMLLLYIALSFADDVIIAKQNVLIKEQQSMLDRLLKIMKSDSR